jgi:hypothetical protein
MNASTGSSGCVCVYLFVWSVCICVLCVYLCVYMYNVLCANIHTQLLLLVCCPQSHCLHWHTCSNHRCACACVCVRVRVCASMCNCVCVRVCARPLCACVPRYPHPATTPSVWCYVGVGVCSLHVCTYTYTRTDNRTRTRSHTCAHSHTHTLTRAHPGVCWCVTAMAQRRWWRWGHTVPLGVGP